MKKIVLLIILGILMPAIGTSAYRKDINVLPVNPAPPFKISIWLSRSAVSPGETISVSFRSSMNCYLTLLDHGSSEKITVIYPNPLSGTNNFVRAGRVYTFPPPGPGFSSRSTGLPARRVFLPTPLSGPTLWESVWVLSRASAAAVSSPLPRTFSRIL